MAVPLLVDEAFRQAQCVLERVELLPEDVYNLVWTMLEDPAVQMDEAMQDTETRRRSMAHGVHHGTVTLCFTDPRLDKLAKKLESHAKALGFLEGNAKIDPARCAQALEGLIEVTFYSWWEFRKQILFFCAAPNASVTMMEKPLAGLRPSQLNQSQIKSLLCAAGFTWDNFSFLQNGVDFLYIPQEKLRKDFGVSHWVMLLRLKTYQKTMQLLDSWTRRAIGSPSSVFSRNRNAWGALDTTKRYSVQMVEVAVFPKLLSSFRSTNRLFKLGLSTAELTRVCAVLASLYGSVSLTGMEEYFPCNRSQRGLELNKITANCLKVTMRVSLPPDALLALRGIRTCRVLEVMVKDGYDSDPSICQSKSRYRECDPMYVVEAMIPQDALRLLEGDFGSNHVMVTAHRVSMGCCVRIDDELSLKASEARFDNDRKLNLERLQPFANFVGEVVDTTDVFIAHMVTVAVQSPRQGSNIVYGMVPVECLTFYDERAHRIQVLTEEERAIELRQQRLLLPHADRIAIPEAANRRIRGAHEQVVPVLRPPKGKKSKSNRKNERCSRISLVKKRVIPAEEHTDTSTIDTLISSEVDMDDHLHKTDSERALPINIVVNGKSHKGSAEEEYGIEAEADARISSPITTAVMKTQRRSGRSAKIDTRPERSAALASLHLAELCAATEAKRKQKEEKDKVNKRRIRSAGRVPDKKDESDNVDEPTDSLLDLLMTSKIQTTSLLPRQRYSPSKRGLSLNRMAWATQAQAPLVELDRYAWLRPIPQEALVVEANRRAAEEMTPITNQLKARDDGLDLQLGVNIPDGVQTDGFVIYRIMGRSLIPVVAERTTGPGHITYTKEALRDIEKAHEAQIRADVEKALAEDDAIQKKEQEEEINPSEGVATTADRDDDSQEDNYLKIKTKAVQYWQQHASSLFDSVTSHARQEASEEVKNVAPFDIIRLSHNKMPVPTTIGIIGISRPKARHIGTRTRWSSSTMSRSAMASTMNDSFLVESESDQQGKGVDFQALVKGEQIVGPIKAARETAAKRKVDSTSDLFTKHFLESVKEYSLLAGGADLYDPPVRMSQESLSGSPKPLVPPGLEYNEAERMRLFDEVIHELDISIRGMGSRKVSESKISLLSDIKRLTEAEEAQAKSHAGSNLRIPELGDFPTQEEVKVMTKALLKKRHRVWTQDSPVKPRLGFFASREDEEDALYDKSTTEKSPQAMAIGSPERLPQKIVRPHSQQGEKKRHMGLPAIKPGEHPPFPDMIRNLSNAEIETSLANSLTQRVLDPISRPATTARLRPDQRFNELACNKNVVEIPKLSSLLYLVDNLVEDAEPVRTDTTAAITTGASATTSVKFPPPTTRN